MWMPRLVTRCSTNGTNQIEIACVLRDHLGELESVMNGGVLGTIVLF
jgi:hypothetical protein